MKQLGSGASLQKSQFRGPLDFDQIQRHPVMAMNKWSIRHFFVLMLAVFVTVGLSASVVEASNMAIKMATSSDMSATSHGECHDCDGGNSGKIKPMVCMVSCVAPVSTALPYVGQGAIPWIGAKLFPAKTALLFGSTSPPDPYPPRSIDLG